MVPITHISRPNGIARTRYFSGGHSPTGRAVSAPDGASCRARAPLGGPTVLEPTADLVIESNRILKTRKDIPGQAHHLNQAAAYRERIPPSLGTSIKLEGNIFVNPDAPHTQAHVSVEAFWDRYRGTERVSDKSRIYAGTAGITSGGWPAGGARKPSSAHRNRRACEVSYTRRLQRPACSLRN